MADYVHMQDTQGRGLLVRADQVIALQQIFTVTGTAKEEGTMVSTPNNAYYVKHKYGSVLAWVRDKL